MQFQSISFTTGTSCGLDYSAVNVRIFLSSCVIYSYALYNLSLNLMPLWTTLILCTRFCLRKNCGNSECERKRARERTKRKRETDRMKASKKAAKNKKKQNEEKSKSVNTVDTIKLVESSENHGRQQVC